MRRQLLTEEAEEYAARRHRRYQKADDMPKDRPCECIDELIDVPDFSSEWVKLRSGGGGCRVFGRRW